MLGQLQDAAEVYETSMSPVYFYSMTRIIFPVLSLDPSLNDVKMRLAGIYEVLHEPRKALDLVYQGTSWESWLNRRYTLHSSDCLAEETPQRYCGQRESRRSAKFIAFRRIDYQKEKQSLENGPIDPATTARTRTEKGGRSETRLQASL
jgi:hypothetical protein